MAFDNPEITVYLNETVDFFIDTPNQPFWIKQKMQLGPGETDPIWANRMDNNGATSGRLRVRFNQPGTYFYVSEVDDRLRGRLIVLPIAKRLPDPPNQIYIVETGLPIAKASDALILIPGDTNLNDVIKGQVFEALADDGQIFQTSAISKYGTGCIAFSTAGAESGQALRAVDGSGTNVLVPFEDSFTLESWVSFSSFNEDDPDWSNDGVDEPFVLLSEIVSNFIFSIFGCDGGPEECGWRKNIFRFTYYHRPLAPDATQVNGRAPYFKVQMWSDKLQPSTDPQVEYEFVLPRILNNGEVTDIISTGIWHHIALTRDVGEQSISLYIDGQRYGRLFDSEIAEPLDLTVEPDYTLAFGGMGAGLGRNEEIPGENTTRYDETFNGYMDDIRITRGIVYRGSTYDVPTEAHPYEGSPPPPAETQSYAYTVTSEAGNYIFNGEGLVDVRDPDLTGDVGDTFTFTLSASGHPFWIKDTDSTGSGNATETWADLSGQGSEVGTVTATFSEPGTYYYICEYHSAMVGTITIS